MASRRRPRIDPRVLEPMDEDAFLRAYRIATAPESLDIDEGDQLGFVFVFPDGTEQPFWVDNAKVNRAMLQVCRDSGLAEDDLIRFGLRLLALLEVQREPELQNHYRLVEEGDDWTVTIEEWVFRTAATHPLTESLVSRLGVGFDSDEFYQAVRARREREGDLPPESVIERLPPPIQETYRRLRGEVVWLQGRWTLMKQVYGSQENLDLLDTVAGHFFFLVQRDMADAIILRLSRLTDPAQRGRNRNLSLERLVKEVEKLGDEDLRLQLDGLFTALKQACSPIRKHRSKLVAHLDYGTTMGLRPVPLKSVTLTDVERAIALAREFLNTLEEHYGLGRGDIEGFQMFGDGESLIQWLGYGQKYVDALRGEGDGQVATDLE